MLIALVVSLINWMPTSLSAQIFNPRIDAIPAGQLPPEFSQAVETQAVDASQFRMPQTKRYTLDAGDVLGVFVEGVLGELNSSPPVHYPDPSQDLPPSMGFPSPVREDGTLSLPLIDPIYVTGLTVIQVEELIKQKYRDPENPVINERSRVLVSLMSKRTIGVFVVRGDNSQASSPNGFRRNTGVVADRSDRSGRLSKIQLPAGDNDLLNALALTGGLPGVNAKSDIKIYRSSQSNAQQYSQSVSSHSSSPSQSFSRSRSASNSPFPRSTASNSSLGGYSSNGIYQSNVTTVPTRTTTYYRPQISPTDAQLNKGDIVVIEPRDTEFYYTSGLLGGGQFLLPRDHGLDVMEAVALAGGTVGATGNSLGAIPQRQPTELIVLRKRPDGSQLPIRVDMNAAISDPRQRIQVQPGDVLILRHSRREQLQNIGIGTFNTFGVRALLGR